MKVIKFNISFDSMPSLEKDGGVGNLRVFGLLNKAKDKQEMLTNWITVLNFELAVINEAIKKKETERKPIQETLKFVVKQSIPDWVFHKPKRKPSVSKSNKVLKYLLDNKSITAKVADDLFSVKSISHIMKKLKDEGHIIWTWQPNVHNKLTETTYYYKGKS